MGQVLGKNPDEVRILSGILQARCQGRTPMKCAYSIRDLTGQVLGKNPDEVRILSGILQARC